MGKIKRSWPRRLSNAELIAVTGWNCLADKKPERGELCDYLVVADEFSGSGRGLYYPAKTDENVCWPEIFTSKIGAGIYIPKDVYWIAAEKARMPE